MRCGIYRHPAETCPDVVVIFCMPVCKCARVMRALWYKRRRWQVHPRHTNLWMLKLCQYLLNKTYSMRCAMLLVVHTLAMTSFLIAMCIGVQGTRWVMEIHAENCSLVHPPPPFTALPPTHAQSKQCIYLAVTHTVPGTPVRLCRAPWLEPGMILLALPFHWPFKWLRLRPIGRLNASIFLSTVQGDTLSRSTLQRGSPGRHAGYEPSRIGHRAPRVTCKLCSL